LFEVIKGSSQNLAGACRFFFSATPADWEFSSRFRFSPFFFSPLHAPPSIARFPPAANSRTFPLEGGLPSPDTEQVFSGYPGQTRFSLFSAFSSAIEMNNPVNFSHFVRSCAQVLSQSVKPDKFVPSSGPR